MTFLGFHLVPRDDFCIFEDFRVPWTRSGVWTPRQHFVHKLATFVEKGPKMAIFWSIGSHTGIWPQNRFRPKCFKKCLKWPGKSPNRQISWLYRPIRPLGKCFKIGKFSEKMGNFLHKFGLKTFFQNFKKKSHQKIP